MIGMVNESSFCEGSVKELDIMFDILETKLSILLDRISCLQTGHKLLVINQFSKAFSLKICPQ